MREVRHQAVVLEHRKELARRQHRLLLFVQADEDLAHRVGHDEAAEGRDRLAMEIERVLVERLAEGGDRVVGFHACASVRRARAAVC